MATKLKAHLNVQPEAGMNDMQFLQTLLHDYTHILSESDVDFKRSAHTVYEPVFPEAAGISEAELALINEVVSTYTKTDNSVIVYNMAVKLKQSLNVSAPDSMNDLQFLQTLQRDHKHLTAQAAGV